MVSINKVLPPPPPGYLDFAEELDLYITFKRITFYNYSVFGEYYHEVLAKEAVPLEEGVSEAAERDSSQQQQQQKTPTVTTKNISTTTDE